MIWLISVGSKSSHPSMIESAVQITCCETSFVVIFCIKGTIAAAHLTAPMRYAKDENEVLPKANSRQSNSSSVLGSGIFCRNYQH